MWCWCLVVCSSSVSVREGEDTQTDPRPPWRRILRHRDTPLCQTGTHTHRPTKYDSVSPVHLAQSRVCSVDMVCLWRSSLSLWSCFTVTGLPVHGYCGLLVCRPHRDIWGVCVCWFDTFSNMGILTGPFSGGVCVGFSLLSSHVVLRWVSIDLSYWFSLFCFG